MRFDPADLRLFLAVAESGSLAAGAAKLRLSLASASARIKGMEADLDTALFVRHRRGLALNASGQAFKRHASSLVEGLDRMRADMAAYGRTTRSLVRLAANTGAASEHLPADLGAFLAANPRIDVEIVEQRSIDVARAVAVGAAAIGVAADTAPLGAGGTLPHPADPFGGLRPPDTAPAARKSLGPPPIADLPMVALPETRAQFDLVAEHAERLGKTLHIRARVPNFDGVARLVASGAGIAVMSRIAAQRAAASLPVKGVALADDFARRRLVLCVRRVAGLLPAARALFEYLKA
ncbi:MAG: LysR family transcriptional regulator [Alphaproteobacteria bacterium]|nr:LysR family transcriptional regulator [Alphaproteobacteria bacterium]